MINFMSHKKTIGQMTEELEKKIISWDKETMESFVRYVVEYWAHSNGDREIVCEKRPIADSLV